MKNFKNFLNEEFKDEGAVYHSSAVKFTEFKNKAVWFAFKKDHAIDGWYKNILDSGSEAFLYEAKFGELNIASESTAEIVELFNKNKLDIDKYTDRVINNPSASQMRKMPGTQLLIREGYDAFVFSDYDPRNTSHDLRALLVFNTNKKLKSLKIIKSDKPG